VIGDSAEQRWQHQIHDHERLRHGVHDRRTPRRAFVRTRQDDGVLRRGKDPEKAEPEGASARQNCEKKSQTGSADSGQMECSPGHSHQTTG
jgi:hypothetical protein